MAQAREYPCGCIIHDVAGKIRACPGLPSRSLSGRLVKRDGGSEEAHNAAMKAAPDKIKLFPVADILP